MNVFYHNLTKKQLNETDPIDLIDQYDPGDLIYKTEAGNAILLQVTKIELDILIHNHEDFYSN